jgi:hypothetical protein
MLPASCLIADGSFDIIFQAEPNLFENAQADEASRGMRTVEMVSHRSSRASPEEDPGSDKYKPEYVAKSILKSIEHERSKKDKNAKKLPFKRQSAYHRNELTTTIQKHAGSKMERRKRSQSKRESRKILETFGPIASEWAICNMQEDDEENCREVFPSDMSEWTLQKFASIQGRYDLFKSTQSFEWGETEGKYTSNMKMNFHFDQKLGDGSVITRRGNVSIGDAKVLVASMNAEFKSDAQISSANDFSDLLYFEFIISVSWSVLIEDCKDTKTINNQNYTESLSTGAIRFKRNSVPIISIGVPLIIIRDWIQTGDGTYVVDSPGSDLGDPSKTLVMLREWDNSGNPMLYVPKSIPEFFKKSGLKMFYLAKENGYMSSEDYDKVIARVDSDYHLLHPTITSRNDEVSSDTVRAGGSPVSPSALSNSGVNSNYSQSNTISATTPSSSLRGVQEQILADAVKLSEIDWKRLKLLARFDNQTFTASEWALGLGYSGRRSRGNAHTWLRSMQKNKYVVLRVQRSKTGSKKGIQVQITAKGIEIIEAIRKLSPF